MNHFICQCLKYHIFHRFSGRGVFGNPFCNCKHAVFVRIFIKHKASVIFKPVAFVYNMFCDIRHSIRSYALHVKIVVIHFVAAVIIIKKERKAFYSFRHYTKVSHLGFVNIIVLFYAYCVKL